MKICKFFSLFSIILLILLVFTLFQTVKSQTNKQVKIVSIKTETFSDSEKGIQEIIDANKILENEFQKQRNELLSLIGNYDIQVKKIETLADPKAPYFFHCFTSIESEVKKLQNLQSEIKSKQEQAKKLYEARRDMIFANIYKRISEAVEQFGKEKNYLIVDSIQVEKAIITDVRDDVTKEFIEFYKEHYADKKLK